MTTAAQPMKVTEETVKAVEGLHKAMKGLGTDDKALINLLCARSAADVAQLVHSYKAHYGKPLEEDLKKEVSGNFGKLISRLAMGQVQADVVDLHDALYPGKAGAEPKHDELIEILTGRTNAELKAIKEAYQTTYDIPLIDAVKTNLKGDFQQFFVVLLAAARDEANHNSNVNADIDALFKAGTGKFGTDEDTFISIINNRGVSHLQKVFEAYEARYKMPIDKVIKKEFNGPIETALLQQVRLIQDRAGAVARQLEDSMAGIGTREDQLTRLVVRYRDPAVMNVVEAAYEKEYKKSLIKRIEGETSGHYKQALVAIIRQA